MKVTQRELRAWRALENQLIKMNLCANRQKLATISAEQLATVLMAIRKNLSVTMQNEYSTRKVSGYKTNSLIHPLA